MFNSSQNNSKDNTPNVNTRGRQFMNKDGFYPSTLIFGYWNDMVSLKMHPALEKSKQTASSVFDYNQVTSTSLTLEKAVILLDKINKKILPAIEENKVVSTSVLIGEDSLVTIGSGIKGEIKPYLGIHKNLDEQTRIPKLSVFYEFSKFFSIEDYDFEAGTYNIDKDIHGEFLLFVILLKEAIKALGNSVSHSIRVVDRYYRERLNNDIYEVASKLGVSLNKGGNNSYYKNGNKGKNIFGDRDSSEIPFDNGTSIENLNNIEEINEFLQ